MIPRRHSRRQGSAGESYIDLVLAAETPEQQRAFPELLAILDGERGRRSKAAFSLRVTRRTMILLHGLAYPARGADGLAITNAVPDRGTIILKALKRRFMTAYYSSQIGERRSGWDGALRTAAMKAVSFRKGNHKEHELRSARSSTKPTTPCCGDRAPRAAGPRNNLPGGAESRLARSRPRGHPKSLYRAHAVLQAQIPRSLAEVVRTAAHPKSSATRAWKYNYEWFVNDSGKSIQHAPGQAVTWQRLRLLAGDRWSGAVRVTA